MKSRFAVLGMEVLLHIPSYPLILDRFIANPRIHPGWNTDSRAWAWDYTLIHLDIKELFYADIGIDPG